MTIIDYILAYPATEGFVIGSTVTQAVIGFKTTTFIIILVMVGIIFTYETWANRKRRSKIEKEIEKQIKEIK